MSTSYMLEPLSIGCQSLLGLGYSGACLAALEP